MERDQLRSNSLTFGSYPMTDDHYVASGNRNSRLLESWTLTGNSRQPAADDQNRQIIDFLATLSNPRANGNPATNPYHNPAVSPLHGNNDLVVGPYHNAAASSFHTNGNSAAGINHNPAASVLHSNGNLAAGLNHIPIASPLHATGNSSTGPYYVNGNLARSLLQNRANGNLATSPYENVATGPFNTNGNPAASPYLTPIEPAFSLYPSNENPALDPYYNLFNPSIELGLSRLSLAPSSAYLPAGLAGYSTIAATAHPHLSIRDIQQMRVESAARATRNRMELYNQLQNKQYIDNFDSSYANQIHSWYHFGGRNLNRNTVSQQRQPRQHPNVVLSLVELRGRIFSLAKDQLGSKYLQDKFKEGRPEDIQMIFMEIKDHVCELMVHQSGNYLMQKFLDVCNDDQMTQLVMLVTDDELQFTAICTDTHGTRAIQKLIEHLKTPEQKSRVISSLRRITVALSNDINGNHIIQHCVNFEIFTVEQIEDILNVVADNCLDIATDKYGCCVLQTCMGKATGVPRDRLLADVSSNALMLSEDQHGNYVVQYAFGISEGVRDNIMAQLSGNFVSLSMNKFGSHVVEKCLQGPKQRQIIMQEIIGSPNFLRVLQDQYGNFVAQVALKMSQGEELHRIMVHMIMNNYSNLHSHPYGQRVLPHTKGSKRRMYM